MLGATRRKPGDAAGPGGKPVRRQGVTVALFDASTTFDHTRLRAFAEAVYDAFYDWEVATGRMDMSAQIDELLAIEAGMLPRTLEGWLGRIHPLDRERARKAVSQAAATGQVFEDEYRMLRGDGEYIVVRDRGVMVRDEGAPHVHMIGAIRDVTRERQAEREQRRASSLYYTLFAQAVNPAYHISESGRFLDANRAGLAFLHTTRSALLKSNVAATWGKSARAGLQDALSGDGSATVVNLEMTVRGEPRSLALTMLPFAFEGDKTCFALGTDVSEHENLRRALEASKESLRRQAASLEDVNTALRVILDRRDHDRTALEQTITANTETVIVPLLERLRRQLGAGPEVIYVETVISNLRQLVRPLAKSLDMMGESGEQLTVREREIANLIRSGKSSCEIGEALLISPGTVAFHRANLRRKLGLEGRGVSLSTYLARHDLQQI